MIFEPDDLAGQALVVSRLRSEKQPRLPVLRDEWDSVMRQMPAPGRDRASPLTRGLRRVRTPALVQLSSSCPEKGFHSEHCAQVTGLLFTGS